MNYQPDRRVDASIDALPDWQQVICRDVRELVHAADLEMKKRPNAASSRTSSGRATSARWDQPPRMVVDPNQKVVPLARSVKVTDASRLRAGMSTPQVSTT